MLLDTVVQLGKLLNGKGLGFLTFLSTRARLGNLVKLFLDFLHLGVGLTNIGNLCLVLVQGFYRASLLLTKLRRWVLLQVLLLIDWLEAVKPLLSATACHLH